MNQDAGITHAPVVACCACRRIRPFVEQPTFWVDAPGILRAAGDNVTHSFCPVCAEQIVGLDLHRYLASAESIAS